MLSHRSSAATVRNSVTNSSGVILSRSFSTARMASYACSRGTKYSLCNSRPLEGVKFILKCGRRSYHGPGMPICSVQLSAEWPVMGCTFSVAIGAPMKSPFHTFCSSGLRRCLSHICVAR